MPRRASYNYQVDPRRAQHKQEVDQQEEDYIFEEEEVYNGEDSEEYQESGDESDDNDEDLVDDSEPESPKRRSTTATRQLRQSTRMRQRPVKNYEESDDENDSPAAPSRRRQSTKRATRAATRSLEKQNDTTILGRLGQLSKDSDQEEDDDGSAYDNGGENDDNEDEEWPGDPDESSDEDFEPARPSKTQAKRPIRSRKRSARGALSDSEEDFPSPRKRGAKKAPARGRPPARQTPPIAKRPRGRPPKRPVLDEDESSDDEPPVAKTRRAVGRPKRQSKRTNSSRKAVYDDDDEDDDESDHASEDESSDDEPPVTKTRRAVGRPKRQSKRKNGSRKAVYEDDDDDESDHASEDESSDDEPPVTKTRRAVGRPKRQSKRKNGSRKAVYDDDDESDHVSEDESSDDEPPVAKTRRAVGRPKRQSKRKNGSRKAVYENEDDDESELQLDREDEEIVKAGRRSRRTQTRNTRIVHEDDLDDSDEQEAAPSPRRGSRQRGSARKSYAELNSDDNDAEHVRPPRFTAARAAQKLEEINEVFGDDDDDDANKSKQSEKLSSDEEFLDSSASEPSAEEAVFDSESEDDDDDDGEASQLLEGEVIVQSVVDIDNEQIGSAESSSDEEETSVAPRATSVTPNSPLDDIVPTQHRDDSAPSSPRAPSPPLAPVCPSTEDAITMEPLPEKHVCWIAPDGQFRQCFCLETLRQIALKRSSMFRPMRLDLDGSAKETFLQPPHFRTRMSDDMLDQIASRFGREALDLDGNFYNRELYHSDDENGFTNEDYIDVFGRETVDYEDDFAGRVNQYLSSYMGSRDAYACPLCYSEWHRRIVHPHQDADEIDDEEFLELPGDSKYDPLTVLGRPDNDKFEAASLFCFTKVADLKKHLRDDHDVDTRDIQGNELYMRYRVRAPDGLLQRYLWQYWNRTRTHTTFQGAMQAYWFEGNNQQFVYLLHLMEKAQHYLSVHESGDDEDNSWVEAQAYLQVGRDFCESINSRSQQEWEQLSSPFRKNVGDEEMEDFLADNEEVDDGEDEDPHFLTHHNIMKGQEEDSDENDLVHKIQRKYAKNDSDVEMMSEGDYEEDDDVEDEVEAANVVGNGYYSEVEEEEDEWVDSIQNKRRKKQLPKNELDDKESTPRTPVGKKISKRKSPSAAVVTTPLVTDLTPVSKRRAIVESDDEGSEEDLLPDDII